MKENSDMKKESTKEKKKEILCLKDSKSMKEKSRKVKERNYKEN